MNGTVRALICDDEPLARRGVAQLLAQHGDVRVVGEASNGREAVGLIETLQPDLLFLDVQMPELDGFGVLERIARVQIPAVVFLTAYEDFAVRAFDAEATDYLVKPVTRTRFDAALRRARERISFRRGQAADPSASPVAGTLVVQTRHGEHVLHTDEIDWIEASDYYAAVHAGGRRFLVRVSLSTFEAQLPDTLFMRVHRSAIVNLARIRSIQENAERGVSLLLRSGAEIPISRRNRPRIERWLEEKRFRTS